MEIAPRPGKIRPCLTFEFIIAKVNLKFLLQFWVAHIASPFSSEADPCDPLLAIMELQFYGAPRLGTATLSLLPVPPSEGQAGYA